MKCPVDGRELLLTHREGIELDYCPECRGVWFDRGELDKVIERSNREFDSVSRREEPRRDDRRDDRRDRHDRDEYRPEKTKKKKASSFLSDLLEFG